MNYTELKEKLQKCKTKEEENFIFEEFWDSNAWIRFILSLYLS